MTAALPLALLAGAAGLGAWAFLRHRRIALAAGAGMLVLLGFKAVVGWLPAAEPALFPWDWYPLAEPWWYGVPAMFLFGAGLVAVRRSVWKRDLLMVLVGLLAVRTIYIASESRFGHSILKGEVDAQGVCLQSSTYSCAPACAAALLDRYGVPSTEREMALLCATRPSGGTSDSGLRRGLRHKLPGRRIEVVAPRYEDLPKPALVSIRFDRWTGHCLLLEKAGPDEVQVIDPLLGRRVYSRRLFERYWQGTAVHVAAE